MKSFIKYLIRIFIAVYSLLLIYICTCVTYNFTPSVPEGFYVRVLKPGLRRGMYVRFKLVERDSALADFLLKQVVGLPGDSLKTSQEGCFINGEYMGGVQEVDSMGKSVSCFIYGGVIPAKMVFVMGEVENSYDSRYFGFVALDEVEAYRRWKK